MYGLAFLLVFWLRSLLPSYHFKSLLFLKQMSQLCSHPRDFISIVPPHLDNLFSEDVFMGSFSCDISPFRFEFKYTAYFVPQFFTSDTVALPCSCLQHVCYIFPDLSFYYILDTTCSYFKLFGYYTYWVSSL